MNQKVSIIPIYEVDAIIYVEYKLHKKVTINGNMEHVNELDFYS